MRTPSNREGKSFLYKNKTAQTSSNMIILQVDTCSCITFFSRTNIIHEKVFVCKKKGKGESGNEASVYRDF